MSVIQQRSVSGVTTSRVGTPSYSKPYGSVADACMTTHEPPPKLATPRVARAGVAMTPAAAPSASTGAAALAELLPAKRSPNSLCMALVNYAAVCAALRGSAWEADLGPASGSSAFGAHPISRTVSRAHCAMSWTPLPRYSGRRRTAASA